PSKNFLLFINIIISNNKTKAIIVAIIKPPLFKTSIIILYRAPYEIQNISIKKRMYHTSVLIFIQITDSFYMLLPFFKWFISLIIKIIITNFKFIIKVSNNHF